MEFITIFLIAGVIVFANRLYAVCRHKAEQADENTLNQQSISTMKQETENTNAENSDTNENNRERNYHTRDFLLETLQKMNIEYELSTDDDERLYYEWQDGHFTIDVTNDSPFIDMWFLQWHEWQLYDIDTLSRVKRIINDVNIKSGISVVYSVNEEAGTFAVHSKKQMLFVPCIPDADSYLKYAMGEFFAVCRYAEVELDKLKNREEATAQ